MTKYVVNGQRTAGWAKRVHWPADRPWDKISSLMNLTVNGQLRQIDTPCTVRQLLVDVGLPDAMVAVELNRRVVPRRQHETTSLREGDELEIVTLVGGG